LGFQENLVLLPARRDLLKAAVGSVVAGAVFGIPAFRSLVAHAQSGTNGIVALRDDLHVLTVGQSNVVAMTGVDGIVLVDGGHASQSTAFLEMISSLPDGANIHTLFNSCWHPEQTGLNETVGRAGATIIAHENTRLWLTVDITRPSDGQSFAPLPEIARPNKTFYARDKLALGDKHVQYGHVRASPHTDGDSYVFFPDSNVLAVGEAVSGAGWPIIDWWTGGWIGGVVGGLESLLVIADAQTRIVPARGPLLRRDDLQAQYEMYAIIYERLAGFLYGGRGPDEAVAARPTNEFDGKMGPSDEFVRQAFKSLWGYLAPDV
jgi:glyoxylase-like metal-dependent hydrolase (beta-lactamase superfamily II)